MISTRILCLGLSAVLLAACGGGSSNDSNGMTKTPAAKLALQTFAADCDDFLGYVADALTEQYLTQYYCFADGPCPVLAALPAPTPQPTPLPTPAPGGALGEDAAPDRVSGTNTQEEGVDEADIVKTDGAGNLYVLTGQNLYALAAFPPAGLDQRPLTEIALDDGDAQFYATDFYLDENADRLVVLGGSYADGVGRSLAVIFDVSEPLAPVEQLRLGVDGYPLQTRRIGSRVHRVSRYNVPIPGWFYDDDALSTLRDDYFEAQADGDEAQADAIREQVHVQIGQRVDAAGASVFLPRSWRQVGPGAPVQTQLGCEAISHPDVTTALGLALVDSFDTDGGEHAVAGIVNNAYEVYASLQNLYLVQSSFGWFFAPRERQAEETAVYRLALSAAGAPVFRAVGVVDGTVNDAYQLSEYDGALRIASTQRLDDDGNFAEPRNHLSVLDAEADGAMPLLGGLRDLAPGETIQGARFLGSRGFIVTFRNVDPLFALDLSDPAAPRVADELKIPGFSSYLAPLGDDYLLTVGREGEDEQLTGALAVQLFDVGDLQNISQLAIATPEAGDGSYSYSSSEYDPHAFSYFADSEDAPVPGTLSIPLQQYGGENDYFTGFLVVRVDPAAAEPLREIGRIDHHGLIDEDEFCAPADGGAAAPCSSAIYAADPRRSVFMQDAGGTYLYTISTVGLLASSAFEPAQTLGSRELPYEPWCCYYTDFGAPQPVP